MKKQSKAAKIRTLLAEGKSVKEIADKLNYTESYVSQVRWHWKKDKINFVKQNKPSKVVAAVKDMDAILGLLKKKTEAEDKAAQSIGSPLYGDRSEWEEKNFWWLDPTSKDQVNHPDHYTVGGIETIDYIEAKKLGYHLGNVVKYVSRAPHKGRHLEDLKKARWYLDREIERVEADI